MDSLQDLQYLYKPHVTRLALESLAMLMSSVESQTLLEDRQDLVIFRNDAEIKSIVGSEGEDMPPLKVFSGFQVKPFSRITFDDWVRENVKTLLEYFHIQSLGAVVVKEVRLFLFKEAFHKYQTVGHGL